MSLQTQKEELYLGLCYIEHSPRVAASENQCKKPQNAIEVTPLSGKWTPMSVWEERHLDLPATTWLPGQWVFQSVDLAKHLTVIPVWAGISPSLFLPEAEVLWQHQGSKTLVAGGRKTTPIRCQVCFTGIVSAVKTPQQKTGCTPRVSHKASSISPE